MLEDTARDELSDYTSDTLSVTRLSCDFPGPVALRPILTDSLPPPTYLAGPPCCVAELS